VNLTTACIGYVLYLLGIVDSLLKNFDVTITEISIFCITGLNIDCSICWIGS
jgi:hypothetical protein